MLLLTGLAILACAGFAASTTSQGRDIIAAVQRFLLFYAGVFALIALTAAVAAGLVATDRIVMPAGGRVVSQSVHRAISLAALGALIVHIALEILAHRSHLIDAVIPFVSSYRTFYMGLGTLASDMLIVIILTGLFRKAFVGRGPVVWRAVHVTAYLMWLFAILHGLLAGRTAKPYVDWSYGACAALVALALLIRILAQRRGGEEAAASPVPATARFASTADIASALPRDIRRPLAAGGPEQWRGRELPGGTRQWPAESAAAQYGRLPEGYGGLPEDYGGPPDGYDRLPEGGHWQADAWPGDGPGPGQAGWGPGPGQAGWGGWRPDYADWRPDDRGEAGPW